MGKIISSEQINLDNEGFPVFPSTFAAAGPAAPMYLASTVTNTFVTLYGGVGLTGEVDNLYDFGTVYATAPAAPGANGTITITFSKPITNFAVNIVDGSSLTDSTGGTFTLSDGEGDRQSVSAGTPESLLIGTLPITTPTNVIYISETGAPDATYPFDFSINNIQYTLQTGVHVAGDIQTADGLSTIAGIALSGIGALSIVSGTVPLFLFAELTEANTLFQAERALQAYNDPPDSNYKSEYIPSAPPPVSLTNDGSVPQNVITDAIAALSAGEDASTDLQGLYVSENRLTGAQQADDSASSTLQQSAVSSYATQASVDLDRFSKALTQVAADLVVANIDPMITAAQYTTFLNSLKSQGQAALPSQEVSLMTTLGFNGNDFSELLERINADPPPATQVSLQMALQQDASATEMLATTLSPDLGGQWMVTGSPGPTGPNGPSSTGGHFSISDQTTHQQSTDGGQPYSGPVAGLQWEYITPTADNINVTSNVANVFIHSGAGNDALNVSQANGNNVLDGSTGSNFLTGGTGNDTFFVDDRNATADIWSTVANFHSGDAATIWGVSPGDFTLSWVDGQGATGYTGLTLHATATGKPNASLTLVGFAQADLSDGRLSVSHGTDPSSGSAYLYVHAN